MCCLSDPLHGLVALSVHSAIVVLIANSEQRKISCLADTKPQKRFGFDTVNGRIMDTGEAVCWL